MWLQLWKLWMHKVNCRCTTQYVLNSPCTNFHVMFSCDCNFVLKMRLTRQNVMQFHVQSHTGSGRGYSLSTHGIRRKWLLWGSHWGLFARFQTDLNTVPCWDHLLSHQMLAERVEGSPLLQSHLWWARKWEIADRWKWECGDFLRLCYLKYSMRNVLMSCFQTYGGVNFHKVIVYYFDIDDLFLLYWIHSRSSCSVGRD